MSLPLMSLGLWPGDARAVLRLGSWSSLRAACAPLREQVFMREQGVPAALEWDEDDAQACHAAVGPPEGPAWATARLLPADPQGWWPLGRLAVDPGWRRQGLGAWLLAHLIDHAQARGAAGIVLAAQLQAEGFYARAGFVAEGPVFEDAGMPHRWMRRAGTGLGAGRPAG